MENHLKAIESGAVTKTNVIGIRKAINAYARRSLGYAVSCTAPRLSANDVTAMERALEKHAPRVVDELHDSGLKLLRSPRYRKRLVDVADVIANLKEFRLIGFYRFGSKELNSTPIYRACGAGRSFDFINIAWQSGGDGPEILSRS